MNTYLHAAKHTSMATISPKYQTTDIAMLVTVVEIEGLTGLTIMLDQNIETILSSTTPPKLKNQDP